MREHKILWAPCDLDEEEILQIIQRFGYDNDSLRSEKIEHHNVRPWRVTVKVERLEELKLD
jgi:hypothetical protein